MPPTRVARPQGQGSPRAQGLPPVPFTAAAHEHTEPIANDVVGAIGAAQSPRGPFDVPAYGFLRHIFMEVIATGGTIGAGVLSADFPHNILQGVQVQDVNGAPIFGPLDGYSLYLANLYGGYAFRSDPVANPLYVATINAYAAYRIPIEISRHNGYGSLANQNAAAAYKLSYIVNSNAVFTTQPTTPPNVTVRSTLEAWSQPNAQDLTGRPQQREPLGHGTTQFWSSFTRAGLAAGQLNLLLPRVGNLIRGLVFVARDATGARSDGVFPTNPQIVWDARMLNNEPQSYRISRTAERSVSGARPVGVFPYLFNDADDGQVGDESPNLWLPTVQSSRLELDGNTTTPGTIQVLTNDIAPVEVRPDERFVETSTTGFHPALGQPSPVAQ